MSLKELMARATHVSSDSRTLESGGLFVALPGRSSDGHDFVSEVLARGAVGVVVRRGWPKQNQFSDARLLEVDDLRAAHREAVGLLRQRFRGQVIAVGGSSGKTSTKEFLGTLLAQRFRVIKTEASQNGELGIPKTLEKLREGVECAIIEVGIDAPSEMIRHAALVSPDLACLTSIGEEHLERLVSVENVFQEERILFDQTLARGGICFAPGSDVWLRRFSGTPGVVMTPADPTLYSTRIAQALREKLPNAYAIQNATLAIGVAKHLGLTEEQVLKGIAELSLPEGRGGVEALASRRWLISDHYNSNPSSLRAGLQAVSQWGRTHQAPIFLYLGDMLDLGEKSDAWHRDLVSDILAIKSVSLVLVGPQFTAHESQFREVMKQNLHCFADSKSAALFVHSQGPQEGVHFVKGSRGLKMEEIVRVLRGDSVS